MDKNVQAKSTDADQAVHEGTVRSESTLFLQWRLKEQSDVSEHCFIKSFYGAFLCAYEYHTFDWIGEKLQPYIL